MPFKINVEVNPANRKVTAQERLFLTADRTRLVAATDKDAAFLFCTPGSEILEADAIRYGLLKEEKIVVPKMEEPMGEKREGKPLEAPEPPAAEDPEEKEKKPEETKEVKPDTK